MKTAAGTAAGTMSSGSPIQIQMSLPSANAVLTPDSQLGLNPSLSIPNAVANVVTPSVAVNVMNAAPSIAVSPLSFKPFVLPAAAKSVAVIAAGPVFPAALIPTLSRLFDGSVSYKGTLAGWLLVGALAATGALMFWIDGQLR